MLFRLDLKRVFAVLTIYGRVKNSGLQKKEHL